MTYRSRQIIFFSAALLFIISAPFVLLRARGYTLSWESGLRFKKNGLILVDSLPASARIFLNGNDTKLKTPARLSYLAPGSYTLALELTGFLPWKERVQVAEETATFADHILLTPDPALTPVWSDSPGLKTAVWRDDGRLAAGWFKDNPSYLILKTADGQPETSLALPALASNAEPNFIFSRNGGSLLLLVADKNKDLHPWVKILDDEDPWQDLGPYLPRPLLSISWAPDYDNALLFRTSHLTAHFFLASRTVVPLATVRSEDVLIRSERLVFGRYLITSEAVKKTSSLWRRETFSTNLELLAELPYSTGWKLLETPAPALLAHDQKNNLLYYWAKENAKPRVYPGTGASLDPNGETLLVWNKNELQVIFIKEARPPKKYALSSPLQKIIWYPGRPVALLVGSAAVSTLTTAPDSIPNQRELYTAEKIITANWAEESRTLAVLSEQEKKRSLVLVNLPNL